MCIIGYAPKGATISDERLRIMFQQNPDGAGIMWKPKDGPVQFRKGFMKLKELLKAWHEVPVDCEKAVHCRIASHGKINKENCHPFPIRSNIDDLSKLTDEDTGVVMHNGIINRACPTKGRDAKYSDTMIFTAHMLANFKTLDDEFVQEDIDRYIGWSRLLIFRENKDTLMFGSWVKDNGCLFSNDTFRDFRTRYIPAKYSLPSPPIEKVPVNSSVFDDIDESGWEDSFWNDIYYED